MFLDILIEHLQEQHLWENSTFLLTSTNGFAFGEHGHFGTKPLRLFQEQTHLPLICVSPNNRHVGQHICTLTQSEVLLAELERWKQTAQNGRAEPAYEQASAKNVPTVVVDRLPGQPYLILENKEEVALRTEYWYLKQPKDDSKADQAELYLKPDDHWEANDVADRCPEQLALLQQFLGTVLLQGDKKVPLPQLITERLV